MDNQQLFLEMLHRLGKYSDACVLYALLAQGGDAMEYTTSSAKISLNLLCGEIAKKQVQRSLNCLGTDGLIEVRALPHCRTCIKVNREAVDALLRKPVRANMPGLRVEGFPYLEHCAAAAA